jgi:hypothetical protein
MRVCIVICYAFRYFLCDPSMSAPVIYHSCSVEC